MLSVKSMVRSACAVGGAVVLLASSASAAVAAPAVFSATGTMFVGSTTANPTISLSYGAAPWQNRTCVPGPYPPPSGGTNTAQVSNTAGQGSLTNLSFVAGTLNCTDGLGYSYQTLINASGPALANVNAGSYSLTSPRLAVRDTGLGLALFADPTPASFTVPYTNGTTGYNGANPSTFTFSNTLVGYVTDHKYGSQQTVWPLRMTGTLRIGTGVTLTLS